MNHCFPYLAVLLLSLPLASVAQESSPTPTEQSRKKVAQEFIQVGGDGTYFVTAQSNDRFIVWGVNYDHDAAGRLIEDYWHDEWETVVEDFKEIKKLGANVVRVHLQLPKFMTSPATPDRRNLDQLRRLVHLAEDLDLYLDVTGLGCYHKQDVPEWYDNLDEKSRWEVQAAFWKAVANVCRDSPAIFCYDLMNEPIIGGGENPDEWLAGKLGDKYFVQRLTLDTAGRSRQEIAGAWVKTLTSAIREVDDRHMITVGVIPWAQSFKGAKPLFYAPGVGDSLDFVSVHFYPEKGKHEDTLAALRVYEIGKPLVIEEIFPLRAGLDETDKFIKSSQEFTDGWISFYWGKTVDEYEDEKTIAAAMMRAWLVYFKDQAAAMKAPPGEPQSNP